MSFVGASTKWLQQRAQGQRQPFALRRSRVCEHAPDHKPAMCRPRAGHMEITSRMATKVLAMNLSHLMASVHKRLKIEIGVGASEHDSAQALC
eukprot:5117564-Amphidinium_carterae.1